MDPRVLQGIVSTAQSLGMNPQDLATVISYETGGTFDPAQPGPRTQWGQHRGLIQFGEPQARQYGVNWADPLGSQLGPNGAVAQYFRANGYQPGMGMMDIYSIVNAGGPGRYGASDAGNGGAPGTVADKVRNQFGPHAARVAQMFGTEPPIYPPGAPQPPQPPGPPTPPAPPGLTDFAALFGNDQSAGASARQQAEDRAAAERARRAALLSLG